MALAMVGGGITTIVCVEKTVPAGVTMRIGALALCGATMVICVGELTVACTGTPPMLTCVNPWAKFVPITVKSAPGKG